MQSGRELASWLLGPLSCGYQNGHPGLQLMQRGLLGAVGARSTGTLFYAPRKKERDWVFLLYKTLLAENKSCLLCLFGHVTNLPQRCARWTTTAPCRGSHSYAQKPGDQQVYWILLEVSGCPSKGRSSQGQRKEKSFP